MASSRFVSLRVLGTLALMGTLCAPFAHAQTETTLYSFTNGAKDGGTPLDLISDGRGNFYGTALDGNGTVFKLSPATGGGWDVTNIYEFPGATGPYYPHGIVMDAAGNIFGVSSGDDIPGVYGLAFELSPNSQGGWTYATLYEFGGSPDGRDPVGVPILDSDGNLYGTTDAGGSCSAIDVGCGIVYELSPQNNGQWKETILHDFGATPQDGQVPLAGLAFDKQGNLYGTTQIGGVMCTDITGCGTVFELIPGKDGSWTEKILYAFAELNHGQYPVGAPVLDSDGNLYATTNSGGPSLLGVVFELTPTPKGSWDFHTVWQFQQFKTGYGPSAAVTLDASGNLYVPTSLGGNPAQGCKGFSNPYECGSVWEFTPNSAGGWKPKLLHVFTGKEAQLVAVPQLVLDSKGHLFGTAEYGGELGYGSIFEITP